MNIVKDEIKKIIKSPIIIVLTIVFILFNLFIITERLSYREELGVLNKIVKTVGYKIDKDMLVSFKNYYHKNLKEANKIISEKQGKNYKSIATFYEDEASAKLDNYNEKEIKKIREVGIIENYYYSIERNDIDYGKINMEEVGEGSINAIKLSGNAAESAKKNYKKFGERLEDIKSKGEERNLFFVGKAYGMHSFLFKSIFRNIIFQCSILTCLITMFILNYEFDNNTSLIIYSTKRGRNLIKDKLLASLICVSLITATILGITLILYFNIFSYDGLWKVPVSSCFNWETGLPFISWFSLNIKQYLILSIVLVYVIQLIFTGIVFLIARITKNTYLGFFIFAIIVAFGLLLPSFMPTNSNLIIYSTFTPFNLILNPSFWFMESGPLTNYKYYELITVIIWVVLMMITTTLGIRTFKREDLK